MRERKDNNAARFNYEGERENADVLLNSKNPKIKCLEIVLIRLPERQIQNKLSLSQKLY